MSKNLVFLIIILFLGLLLRVLFINSSPPALYGDELTITLDAYSLLKTGQDQLGNFLPLTFPMGAGRPAGYVYGSVPFVAIFGPTAMGVRALSILAGLGIILLLYLTGRKLFSERLGMWAALMGAVSPWDLSLSRGGFEAHFALFLSFLGVYLFLKAREKPFLYLFSALSFGLTLHTYPTYKISLFLFLPLLIWFQGRKQVQSHAKRYLLGGVMILLFFGILSLSQIFVGGSETRFSDINILSQGILKNSIEQKINLERQISRLPNNLVKYFHNKPVEYSKVLIENYLQNFSVDFLFLHGDRNPRHNMGTMGGLYTIEIILLIMGILTLWQKSRKTILFLLLWIIIAPIPTAIVDWPHALRSSFMLPPLIIISASGFVTLLDQKNKLGIFLVASFFFIQFLFLIQKLYFLAPNEYSNFWSYPAKLAFKIAASEKANYDYIILSDRINDMEFAYPVYSKADPDEVIAQNKQRVNLMSYPVKKFDNIYIGSITEKELLNFISRLPGSVLYLGTKSEGENLSGYEVIKSLNKEASLVLKRKN
ncbi:glycosyltransferase family 39 protein [Candidatus Daviesbacteria bacterium]|nr:glycosyltransferase family 39 protein [Candidatus Daviesbacteria bacterium]